MAEFSKPKSARIQKRIMTIECIENRGDRRRLQYDMPMNMNRHDWERLVDQIDHQMADIMSRMETAIEQTAAARSPDA